MANSAIHPSGQLGICGTALVANTLSHPVQIGTIDAHGTQQQISSIHQ